MTVVNMATFWIVEVNERQLFVEFLISNFYMLMLGNTLIRILIDELVGDCQV